MINCKTLILTMKRFLLLLLVTSYLMLNFSQWLSDLFFLFFSHIRRLGNSVVHNLAKHTRHFSGLSVWMEDVLSHLSNVIAVDVIGVS